MATKTARKTAAATRRKSRTANPTPEVPETGTFSSGPEANIQETPKTAHDVLVDIIAPQQSITLSKRLTEKGGLTSFARSSVRSSVYTTRNFFAGALPENLIISAPAGTFAEPGQLTPEKAADLQAQVTKAQERATKAAARAAKLASKLSK